MRMLLQNVLDVIDRLEGEDNNLEADDLPLEVLSDHQQELIKNFTLPDADDDVFGKDDAFTLDGFDTKKLWNLANLKQKKNVINKKDVLETVLETIVEKLRNCCSKIAVNFQRHVEGAKLQDPRSLDLIRFYGTFYPVKIPRASRQSEGAVSGRSDCSVGEIGSTLDAAKIHYNMFQDEQELSFQRFKRFEMGGNKRTTQVDDPNNVDDDPKARSLESLIKSHGLARWEAKLMKFLPDALINLQHARSFLSTLKPLEPVTQMVFVAFLKDLMTKMNENFDKSSDAGVVGVNGMETLSCRVTISESYMQLRAQKRRKPHHGIKSKETTLTIKSDVVVIQGRADKYKDLSTGKQLQNLFLECKMNIEMKQWELLVSKKNKSPLTQVAAESMARYMTLEKDDKLPTVLFSILTDCSVLYSVYHRVQEKEYWISRSVDTAEEILVSLCWLYLGSIGLIDTERFDENVRSWESPEEAEAEDDEDERKGTNEEKSSSRLESVDENDEMMDNDHQDHSMGEAQHQNSLPLPVWSFEELEQAEREEEERLKWQTFFLLENHRKYGTPLPLTEAFLTLHNDP